MGVAAPHGDLVVESRRVLQAARERGIDVRLAGGLAVRYLCPSAQWPSLRREYADLDLAIVSGANRRRLTELMVSLGYHADAMLNALNEGTRLRFDDNVNHRHVDVFVDAIRMCHVIEFKNRIKLFDDTLPPTDLLLTKLQIVELNRKDVLDAIALLHDHELDTMHLERVWGNDWALWKTSHLTLEKIRGAVTSIVDPEPAERVLGAVAMLQSVLESGRKTLRWKVRAQVGERVRWYELPEDAG